MRAGRSGTFRLPLAGLCLSAAAAWQVGAALGAGDDRPSTPFTCLFDLGASWPRPLPGRAVMERTGWRRLPEDDLTHAFTGDTALLNDKLAVVFRKRGAGAEVYSRCGAGWKQRVVLAPLGAASRSLSGLSAVKIHENDPGAVAVGATFTTGAGTHVSMVLRLTTGRQVLEVRPGKGAERLVVWSRPRYVVVPDFFGDDMVFGPEAFPCPRHGLPTENFFLHLLGGGEAIVMCVWESSRQGADALLQDRGGSREIGGCEIRCARDEPIWVAFMEGPGIWHRRAIAAGEETAQIVLDWRPPFAAKWRADLLAGDGLADSRTFADRRQPGRRCWFDGDRAVVRIGPATEQTGQNALPCSILTYPIDRTKATPLTAFTAVDVLRDTLGIGPCQYVLQTEGLASKTNPTPGKVMDWVERQFDTNKEQEGAPQIADLLGQMTEHVAHAQRRIDAYAEFAVRVEALCTAAGEEKDPPEDAGSLGLTARRVRRIALASRGKEDPAGRAARLADEIVGLIGKEDALAECRRVGALVRKMGDLQDRTLSDCRMGVRWLKQKARMKAVADPSRADLAREVRAQAETVLGSK